MFQPLIAERALDRRVALLVLSHVNWKVGGLELFVALCALHFAFFRLVIFHVLIIAASRQHLAANLAFPRELVIVVRLHVSLQLSLIDFFAALFASHRDLVLVVTLEVILQRALVNLFPAQLALDFLPIFVGFLHVLSFQSLLHAFPADFAFNHGLVFVVAQHVTPKSGSDLIFFVACLAFEERLVLSVRPHVLSEADELHLLVANAAFAYFPSFAVMDLSVSRERFVVENLPAVTTSYVHFVFMNLQMML